MKTSNTLRGLAATAVSLYAAVVRASGETGTGAVSEMEISGAQFGMMVGGLAVLGLVIWGVAKFTGK